VTCSERSESEWLLSLTLFRRVGFAFVRDVVESASHVAWQRVGRFNSTDGGHPRLKAGGSARTGRLKAALSVRVC